MKPHRDIEVTQKAAMFMLHRLRDSWGNAGLDKFLALEVDETYMEDKCRNISNKKHKALKDAGRDTAGKTATPMK